MFKMIIALAIVVSSQATLAEVNECQTAYRTTVKQCAQDLDFLSPFIRAGAQKACVVEAKLDKDVCLSGGGNTCLSTCDASYSQEVAICNSTYDPVACNFNPECEGDTLQQRAICTSAAVDALSACTAACQ